MKIAIEQNKTRTLITLLKKDETAIFIDVFSGTAKGDAFFTVFDKDKGNVANGYGKLDDVCSDVEKYIDEI